MAKGLAESWAIWMLMGVGCYGAGLGTGALITLWAVKKRFRCFYSEWAEQIRNRN